MAVSSSWGSLTDDPIFIIWEDNVPDMFQETYFATKYSLASDEAGCVP